MAPKRKSAFARFLSLNQHRKRWGASKHSVGDVDYDVLKNTIITAGDPVQTRGSAKSLDTHLEALRGEFSGQSELIWYHAKLIVLLRREYQKEQTFQQFQDLWQAKQDYLLEHLNIRWMVSATDTFAEYDPDPQTGAIAMMASLFVNTVKMYESERYLCNAQNLSFQQKHIDIVHKELVPLFEGMSCFTIGTDDTLRNMYWRLEPFFKAPPSGPILREIWNRMSDESSVFARMRALHTRDRTAWWDA